MDTILSNGDFALNGSGKPYLADGIKEIIQRCFIVLSVKKNSFIYNRELGCDLYTIDRDDKRLKSTAELLVKEALLCVPQAEVKSVDAFKDSDNLIHITVKISCCGQIQTFEVTV